MRRRRLEEPILCCSHRSVEVYCSRSLVLVVLDYTNARRPPSALRRTRKHTNVLMTSEGVVNVLLILGRTNIASIHSAAPLRSPISINNSKALGTKTKYLGFKLCN